DAVVTPAEGVHDVAGPPGQGVGARSIEDHQAGLGNLLGAIADGTDRHRARALDVALAVFLPCPDVDDVGVLAPIEPRLQLFHTGGAGGGGGGGGGGGAGKGRGGGADVCERPAPLSPG